ncbi:hypothetical protein CDCA_CDCA01G0420 [Cyanidium caldarium]|uniref:Preprotein translocase subunit SecE n=1 Tax=Cyanidium caldarium TaxID=2771 RepID=A0AAV9IQ32_CYACA|nr:hypothetical protein CDCA_CDCA01G0420 [Cyanidium caldarium]
MTRRLPGWPLETLAFTLSRLPDARRPRTECRTPHSSASRLCGARCRPAHGACGFSSRWLGIRRHIMPAAATRRRHSPRRVHPLVCIRLDADEEEEESVELPDPEDIPEEMLQLDIPLEQLQEMLGVKPRGSDTVPELLGENAGDGMSSLQEVDRDADEGWNDRQRAEIEHIRRVAHIRKQPMSAYRRRIAETVEELRMVEWPNANTVLRLTVATIALLIVMSIFLYSVDTFFSWAINLFLTD